MISFRRGKNENKYLKWPKLVIMLFQDTTTNFVGICALICPRSIDRNGLVFIDSYDLENQARKNTRTRKMKTKSDSESASLSRIKIKGKFLPIRTGEKKMKKKKEKETSLSLNSTILGFTRALFFLLSSARRRCFFLREAFSLSIGNSFVFVGFY